MMSVFIRWDFLLSCGCLLSNEQYVVGGFGPEKICPRHGVQKIEDMERIIIDSPNPPGPFEGIEKENEK